MNDLSKVISADLNDWVESRIADGQFFDASDYVRDLIRRDRAQVGNARWVRSRIEEGLASGIVDAEPEDIVEDIIARYSPEDG